MEGRDNRDYPVKWLIFTVGLGVFIGSFNISLLNVSLPSIALYFDSNLSTVSWALVIYLVVLSGTILAFGRLADIKGVKKIFISGFAVFTAGTFLCGFSPGIHFLIFFRMVQAVGGAMLSATAPVIIVNFLPKEEKGFGLGIIATLATTGIALGAVAGGIITSFAGWQYIFFFCVPIGVAGMLLAYRFIPKITPGTKVWSFDIPGTVFMVLGISTLLLGLNKGREFGWTSTPIVAVFVLSAIFWIAFIVWENRANEPVLDFRLFGNNSFVLANISGFMIKTVFTGIILIFTLYFEIVKGFDLALVGLLLLIPATVSMIVAPFAGKVSDKVGSKMLCTSGCLTVTMVFLIFSLFAGIMGYIFSALALAVFGFSMGIFLTPNRKLILGHSPPDKKGVSSGIMKTFGNFGSALGIIIFGTALEEIIGISGGEMYMAPVQPVPEFMVTGFTYTFAIALMICLATTVLTFFVKEPEQEL
ncbi:MFS transporter [Methanolacinia paynteri]|uniref:MFS transporter n=1 Tax=Methanolacinia paynteri TaxID=230356 RepID=UPI00064FF262|nr:MFS transporter [Methanolacinia paynteri]